MDRVILHSDLNGFYASVECAENPALKGLPVAVCGDAEARHGIVLAKNEIAKKYKIKTGDVIWEAKKKCPALITITADFKKYVRYSQIVKNIYNTYTDKVESFGIDEAWLDVTGLDGEKTANELRERIKTAVGLTASVGVSWNKIYAKLGSDIKKPDATTVISRQNYKQIIFPLPVGDLLYVGRATQAKLISMGVTTIGGLAGTDIRLLKQRLGKWGEYIWTYANGYDASPVAVCGRQSAIKSVSNSTVSVRDLKTINDVRMIVTVLSESVAERLREQGLKGQVVSIFVRDNNLETWSKQQKIKEPTFLSKAIIEGAMELFKNYNFQRPIRGIGVSLTEIISSAAYEQLSFLDDKKQIKDERLEEAVYKIRRRFGHFAINRGIEYLDKKLTGFSPKTENISCFPKGN